jgi:hypothetical protein
MYLLAVVAVSASHTIACTAQRIRREKRFADLRDRDPFGLPGLRGRQRVLTFTSLPPPTASAAGSRFTTL